jgi:hypothetical protein
MTITELEQSFGAQGLRARCEAEIYADGEVRIVVADADGHNQVPLRFPYKGLDEADLPKVLLELYWHQIKVRRAKHLIKKGIIK